jgi:hypothetical protein
MSADVKFPEWCKSATFSERYADHFQVLIGLSSPAQKVGFCLVCFGLFALRYPFAPNGVRGSTGTVPLSDG